MCEADCHVMLEDQECQIITTLVIQCHYSLLLSYLLSYPAPFHHRHHAL